MTGTRSCRFRTLMAAGATLLALASTGSVFAGEFALAVSPPRFELQLKAGESSRQVLEITNAVVEATYISANAKAPAAVHKPSPDFAPSDTSNLAAGDEVEHQKFGFGAVTLMEGSAHNPIATVNFKIGGEKKIMLNYAKLRIIKP